MSAGGGDASPYYDDRLRDSNKIDIMPRMKSKTAYTIIALIVLISAFAYAMDSGVKETPLSPVSLEIKNDLKKGRAAGVSFLSAPQMSTFYKVRDFEPAWSSGNDINNDAKQLWSSIENIGLDGLKPEMYHSKQLERLLGNLNNSEITDKTITIAQLDLLFTDAFFRLAANLSNGITYPFRTDYNLYKPRKGMDLPLLLQNALAGNEIRYTLDSLKPKLASYRLLRDELVRYKMIAEAGGWPSVGRIDGKKKKVEPGETHPIVAKVRERLSVTEKLGPVSPEMANVYDPALIQAVRKYQQRQGLNADGVIGKWTIDALNKSVQDRVCQIKINLDRMRAMSDILSKDRFVFANIPAFELDVMENGKSVLDMRVIVGRYKDKSPMLDELMEFIVFSPRWHVPESIAIKEEFGKLKEDPTKFKRRGMRMYKGNGQDKVEIDYLSQDWSAVEIDASEFEYTFVQDAGRGNALGGIKFLFPNDESVYMHDTPTKPLFKKDIRAFSHGCIRIEKPVEMAEYLLKDDEKWTRERIEKESKRGDPMTVTLKEKLPVHIMYLTAWADEDGDAQFRRDIYHYDRGLMKIFCGN